MKLLIKKNQSEYEEKTAYGEVNPVGRDEFTAAGQRGFKASFMVEVWGFEYGNQTEIKVGGHKLVIYRTYGPKPNGKIELYAGERVGRS